MTYFFRYILFQLLYFVPIMALKHINPYYSLLIHLYYFRLLYALHVSISIKPIISYYFNQIETRVIIAIIDIIVGTPCCNVLSHPLAFITYRDTSQKPMNWQNTSCIRPLNPPCCRLALRQNDCAGGLEWFLCHWQELLAVSPGYSQVGWLRELVSFSWARIVFGNRQIPASLKDNIVLNWYNCYNIFNWYNHHFQDRHRWNECAFEGLGSNVSHSRCWE